MKLEVTHLSKDISSYVCGLFYSTVRMPSEPSAGTRVRVLNIYAVFYTV